MNLFSTKEAADYLDISVPGLRYHIEAGNINPTLVGKTLVFTKDQLDKFQSTRLPAGRPKSKED